MGRIREKKIDSRREFVNTLETLGDNHILVTCDVGFNYLDDTKIKTFNFGVTEQSSALISSALALSGYTVWFYSMINFVTFRVHEMIRNGIVMHKSNVKIIGVKGSEAYRFLGFSHNLLREDEEIDFLSPMMPCHKPKPDGVEELIRKVADHDKPCYIRL